MRFDAISLRVMRVHLIGCRAPFRVAETLDLSRNTLPFYTNAKWSAIDPGPVSKFPRPDERNVQIYRARDRVFNTGGFVGLGAIFLNGTGVLCG